jgi:hypothetical protein
MAQASQSEKSKNDLPSWSEWIRRQASNLTYAGSSPAEGANKMNIWDFLDKNTITVTVWFLIIAVGWLMSTYVMLKAHMHASSNKEDMPKKQIGFK